MEKLKVKRLYHLTADPHEQHDLARQPGQLERMKTLFANLQTQQKKHGDTLELASAFPELAPNLTTPSPSRHNF